MNLTEGNVSTLLKVSSWFLSAQALKQMGRVEERKKKMINDDANSRPSDVKENIMQHCVALLFYSIYIKQLNSLFMGGLVLESGIDGAKALRIRDN